MRQQVNLYQPIFRKQKKKFSAAAMAQASLMVFGGIMLFYLYMQWQIISLNGELAREQTRQQALAQQLQSAQQKFKRPTENLALKNKVERMQHIISARQQIKNTLENPAFSNKEGYSNQFIALARQHIKGLWLTSFEMTGKGENVRISGKALEPELVPRYIQKLSREKSMIGTHFDVFMLQQPREKEARHYIEFTIQNAENTGGGS